MTTPTIEEILHIAANRGVRLDLCWEHPDPSRAEKLHLIQLGLQEYLQEDGKIRPSYSLSQKGRLVSIRPTLRLLPRAMIWQSMDLLSASIPGIEIILAAKLAGEEQLYQPILEARKSPIQVLVEISHMDTEAMKDAFYSVIFRGCRPGAPLSYEAKEQAEKLKAWIRVKYPKLTAFYSEQQRKRIPAIFAAESAILLSVAAIAETLPGCQVVGFHHSTPLIEWDRTPQNDPRETSDYLKNLTYDLLQAWTGKAVYPPMTAVSTPPPYYGMNLCSF